MLISDLKKMESIVSSNSNLSWDGWNVVHLKKSKDAMYKTNGAFVDGSWYVKTIYKLDSNGWNIKNSHVGE